MCSIGGQLRNETLFKVKLNTLNIGKSHSAKAGKNQQKTS